MVHFSTVRRAGFLMALAVLATGCSGGSSTGDASPRISAIPQQLTAGGTALSLDVGEYVVDRENSALTYAVVTGGGSFADSTYSNTFATMGSFQVSFKVTDEAGNESIGTFDVDVTSGNFAVVREDTSGLQLLDTDTNSAISIAASISSPAFATTFSDGRLVFQRGLEAALTLASFEPFTRRTTEIGDPLAQYVTYRARTSDGRVVFTTGAPTDTDLFLFNTRTRMTTELSATVGEIDGDALVNNADLIFYERGAGGQSDIYYYDPSTDTTAAVAADANDEQLLAVLADGGVVFSRVGAGGETDLYYFDRATGLAEVGANTPALDTRDKLFAVGGSQGQIVFTAQNGADIDLFAWDPQTGIDSVIASPGVHAVEGIGAGDEVVYRTEVSGTEHDLYFYDLTDGTTAAVRDASDLGSVLAITGDGTTNWAIVQGSSTPSSVSAVKLIASPVMPTHPAGGTLELGGLLQGGDVVVQRTDGTELVRFDLLSGGWDAAIVGAGLAFGGDGVDAGDFVYMLTVDSQSDLSMWDESANTTVIVSDTAGDDVYQSASLSGTVLFSRVTAPNTNADLFSWHPTNGEIQITDVDPAGFRHDYTVLDIYAGATR